MISPQFLACDPPGNALTLCPQIVDPLENRVLKLSCNRLLFRRPVVFSFGLLALQSRALLSFCTITGFSFASTRNLKFSRRCLVGVIFSIRNCFKFCAYTVTVSFRSLSTGCTALQTQMISFLTRSTGRFSGIVNTIFVHDPKKD